METTEPRWLSDEEQATWRSYLRMDALLQARTSRALQERSDLSQADFEVLVNLSEAEGGRVRAFLLARAMQWEKSRLSHQLTRMERRGLIARETCPTDARGAFVVLTDLGRTAIEQAAPGHAADVRDLVFDVLTPAQVKAFKRICDTVLERMEDDGDDPGETCAG